MVIIPFFSKLKSDTSRKPTAKGEPDAQRIAINQRALSAPVN